METMALGIFALTLLIGSGCCLCCKKPVLGFAGSIAAMVLTYLTGSSWRGMLIDGGKDTYLLGFERYPAAPVILAILLLSAFAVMIVSIIWMSRRNKNKNMQ